MSHDLLINLEHYLLNNFLPGAMLSPEWATKMQEPSQLKSLFYPPPTSAANTVRMQSEPIKKGQSLLKTAIK